MTEFIHNKDANDVDIAGLTEFILEQIVGTRRTDELVLVTDSREAVDAAKPKRKLTARFFDPAKTNGFCVPCKGGVLVYVDPDLNSKQTIITLAHELTHARTGKTTSHNYTFRRQLTVVLAALVENGDLKLTRKQFESEVLLRWSPNGGLDHIYDKPELKYLTELYKAYGGTFS